MTARTFQPGFRLSALDLSILAVAALGVAITWTWHRQFAVCVAFVVLHFFLFCNVLRLPRPHELAWAGVFTAMATLAVVGRMGWPVAFGLSAAMTVVVMVMGIRLPSYHGVGWRRVNPGLQDWWESKQAANEVSADSAHSVRG